jgi:DNA modification methylase
MFQFYNQDSTQPIVLEGEKMDLVYFDPMFKTKSEQNNYTPVRHRNQAQMVEKRIEPIYPPHDEYERWMEGWVQNAANWVKPSGWVVIKLDDFTAYECWPIFKKYLKWENTVIWDKRVIGLGRRLRKQHELLLFLKPKDNKATYFHAPNIVRGRVRDNWHGSTKGLSVPTVWKTDDYLFVEDVREFEEWDLIDDVWQCLQDNGGLVNTKVKRMHINATPVGLFDRIMTVFIPPHGWMLDLCMGSGAAGVACKNFEKHYTGFELQPHIYEIGKDRILNSPIYAKKGLEMFFV